MPIVHSDFRRFYKFKILFSFPLSNPLGQVQLSRDQEKVAAYLSWLLSRNPSTANLTLGMLRALWAPLPVIIRSTTFFWRHHASRFFSFTKFFSTCMASWTCSPCRSKLLSSLPAFLATNRRELQLIGTCLRASDGKAGVLQNTRQA